MNNLQDDSHNKSEIILYQTEDGKSRIEVKLYDETVWLSQKLMAELFQKSIPTINEHIKNIFKESELQENTVIRKFRITADDGKSYLTNFFNLDVIISVGYRVKSHRGTQFRIWATEEYEKFRMTHLNAPSAVERHFEEAVKDVKRLEKEVKPQKAQKNNLKT